MLTVYIDADACPNLIREIIFRAAIKRQFKVVQIANSYIPKHRSDLITSIQVAAGPDVADDKIVELIQPGELCISADIPLASEIIKKGGLVINPHGEVYSERNIANRLATRDLMAEIRSTALDQPGGGQKPFSDRDKQNFANSFDRYISKALKI